ncbi:hypothetical protein [Cylindrospermopsis raciborskii]|uniref:hypothetical protein n=1 Tax=Cylindrospermopsis raciborskii TaxID=77022 RepID=UPI002155EF27|nr:hypothetical protein [Cylindrospermopsis raciborskii]
MHSLWEIALSDYPPVPSQGKILNVLRGVHLGTFPGILLKGKSERMEGRSHCTPFGKSLLEVIPWFLLKGKLEHTEGRSHCTPYGTSLSSRDVSCSVRAW